MRIHCLYDLVTVGYFLIPKEIYDFRMKRFWNALICGHLLGLITLAGCYFANSLLLPMESGLSPLFILVISFSAVVIGFAVAFFLMPNRPKA